MPSSNGIETALLTGVNGFTGRYLEPALRTRGYRLVRVDPSGSKPCDLTDPQAAEEAVQSSEPDVVIQLAAVTYLAHRNAGDFCLVNVLGTLNLLQALARLKRLPRRIIIASSANVYGSPEAEVRDEALCPASVNHYAMSKLAMEHMVRTWF